MLRPARACHQRGATLMESLVAMLVLSVGVGALAWTQARHLANGRDTTARSIAVQLTDDLANRMLFNRSAAAQGRYLLGWGERPPPTDCRDAPCTASMLARSDLATWRDALARALPGSDALVFAAPPEGRRIGIAIAWRVQSAAGTTWQLPAFTDPVRDDLACPTQSLCHVTYVPI